MTSAVRSHLYDSFESHSFSFSRHGFFASETQPEIDAGLRAALLPIPVSEAWPAVRKARIAADFRKIRSAQASQTAALHPPAHLYVPRRATTTSVRI